MSRPASVLSLYQRLRLPVFVAPMFLISGPDLVVAVGKAGLLAALPTPNARSIDALRAWMTRISKELDAADRSGMWGVNMIVHKTYDRYDAELDLICEFKPRLVVTALGSPARPAARVHGYGGAVFADVISVEQARKAVGAGADGLIIVGAGAGGHTGEYSPFAFVDEVRSFWEGPLVLAGAIGNARAVRAALALGADFAYMGTHFIAARESMASDDYREMLVRSGITDIVASAAVSGIRANWLRESLQMAGMTGELLQQTTKVDFSNLHDNSRAWKTIWGAGQAVGAVRSTQTAAAIIDELCLEYEAENGRIAGLSWPRAL